ncbi:hypothetical protein RRF57_011644 [Xylaria bambusicola]|uniref:Uncharacterized protein n=1 Tax=Xylaria bambusicola TaxID=326684 RepID=A0AAN7ZA61_9PEZI
MDNGAEAGPRRPARAVLNDIGRLKVFVRNTGDVLTLYVLEILEGSDGEIRYSCSHGDDVTLGSYYTRDGLAIGKTQMPALDHMAKHDIFGTGQIRQNNGPRASQDGLKRYAVILQRAN